MSDQSIAADIREKVDALNGALREAARAGLQCDVSTIDVTVMGDANRVEFVSVEIKRPIYPE